MGKRPRLPPDQEGLADPAWRGPAVCMSLAQCSLRQDLGFPGKVTLLPPPLSSCLGAQSWTAARVVPWQPGRNPVAATVSSSPLPPPPTAGAGGGGCQPHYKNQLRLAAEAHYSDLQHGPPDSCTPAMASSLLAWLLCLAVFFDLCTLLTGEWLLTLPEKEGRGVLGCRLQLPGGEIRPCRSRPFKWLLGLGGGRER